MTMMSLSVYRHDAERWAPALLVDSVSTWLSSNSCVLYNMTDQPTEKAKDTVEAKKVSIGEEEVSPKPYVDV